MTEALFGPLTLDWIAAYAVASGDDNPLHIANGPHQSAIVHGGLIAALAERYVLRTLPSIRIRTMHFTFLSTVKAGESLAFRLGQGRSRTIGDKVMTERRITVQVPGRRPCVIGDCVYEELR